MLGPVVFQVSQSIPNSIQYIRITLPPKNMFVSRKLSLGAERTGEPFLVVERAENVDIGIGTRLSGSVWTCIHK